MTEIPVRSNQFPADRRLHPNAPLDPSWSAHRLTASARPLTIGCLALTMLLGGMVFRMTAAQENLANRFEAASSKGVLARRDGDTVYLDISDDTARSVTIPRLAAPVKSLRWRDAGGARQDPSHKLTLTPEPNSWKIHWKSRPLNAKSIALELATAPKLTSELGPIKATADGSLWLPAHLAKTTGNKLRYEPQTHKNTVGYWTLKDDYATWTFQIESPGRFNIAILQGCGKGHGGSTARLDIVQERSGKSVASVEFDVLDTGHFQNFQWRHIGRVELPKGGQFDLRITPINIQKAALMDVRAVHLVRLP